MFLLLILFSCEDDPIFIPDRCSIQINSVTPTTLSTEEEASVNAGPLTKSWDTLVTINGTKANINKLERLGCDECDNCRKTNACHPCQDCDVCDPICKRDCSETVTIQVPIQATGNAKLQIINSYGQSNFYDIELENDLEVSPEDSGN